MVFPDHVGLDRAISLALIALALVEGYRQLKGVRARLLWPVSRQLLLSYMLVGAVPVLLLVTFFLLAFLLIFFDVSSYLVQSRVAGLTEQANTFARTTLFEVERTSEGRLEIAGRRESAISTRFPGVSVAVLPAEALPPWLAGRPFSGLVIERGKTIARAVAVSHGEPSYAVVVDLPVDQAVGRDVLAPAGIALGETRGRSLLNTATFLTHVDWQSGQTTRSALPMSVDVRVLYRFLGRSQDNGTALSFNQLLLYALVGIGALLLVIEIVALGNGLALARSITAAVDELFSGTEQVKNGEFGQPIAVRSTDQLGQLAVSFNDMTARIRALLLEQNEKRRLAEELRIARDIQMSLLPHGPFSEPGLSIAAMCAPAREVGGDYYDFLPISDGRLGLLIADVSGKGTSAALYMAEMKGLMLALSRVHTSPRALLIEADRIISRHLDSHIFITMTYALVDRQAMTLTCARAGHCPFIRIPATPASPRIAEVLTPDGMVLGLNLDGGERFERCLKEIAIPLQAGDLFVFFTDGISDAMNDSGDCFGETRLTDFLQAHADRSPGDIRDRLVDEVEHFAQGQPQHDDITMIILRIDG